MIDIEKYRPLIDAACREFRIEKLDIVGSAARGDVRPDSDIDVLVSFEGDGDLFSRYFGLKERLEAIFGRSVDVVEERALRNPYILRTMQRDRQHLYGS